MKRAAIPIVIVMMVLTASWLWTAPVTLPYPPIPNTMIRATEQLANYNAIIIGVNSINNAQVAIDAAIDGFKIKALSIGYDRLASSVTDVLGSFSSSIASAGIEYTVLNPAGSSTINFQYPFSKGSVYLDGIKQSTPKDYSHTTGSTSVIFVSPIPYGVDSCGLITY